MPTPDLVLQRISDQAIGALLRAAAGEPDPVQRQRDRAALALLVYASLRIQEACHLQLRGLDLGGGSKRQVGDVAGTAGDMPACV